ncbi:hypothetical protein FIBSPDRAFT_949474 [Athelia psychrophila]|uniref:DUF6533 domain-containing protein n=1 Tax=Athelia psychrophila TaxID=1759441 RepID=A0A166PP48_9AGAM|nr:hypothetical protein FIBSPDRAFT_949474 [Fibularhizoctonia sp. CBS 109695]
MTSPLQDVSEIFTTRLMGCVSLTILIWDHVLTFPDEVKYIWKGGKGPLVWLFFINRYLTPLGFIINIVAYNLQSWSAEPLQTDGWFSQICYRCARYVRYEGAMTVIGIEIVALMMLLRIRAIYSKVWQATAVVAFVLFAETATNVYLLMNAVAVPHSSGVHSCSMIFDPNTNGGLTSASAWLPLLYDTIILGLTLHRTMPAIRHKEAGQIIRTILRDGLIYYSVIFMVTLVLTIMIAAAPAGLKNVTAQLELLLTVAMMSRITLHLKREGQSPDDKETSTLEVTFSQHRHGFFDATTRTREEPSGSDYLTGGADSGLYFTRPTRMRRLSTIKSSIGPGWSAEATPEGLSPVSGPASPAESARDVADMFTELIHEDRHGEEIEEERRRSRRLLPIEEQSRHIV